jgi:hypothetical protein
MLSIFWDTIYKDIPNVKDNMLIIILTKITIYGDCQYE